MLKELITRIVPQASRDRETIVLPPAKLGFLDACTFDLRHAQNGAGAMTIRTTVATVEFRAPFKLAGYDEILPAGIYRIDTDEEAFESTERTVYHRVETRLRIQTLGKTVHRRVDPHDLDAALRQDREPILTKAVRPYPEGTPDKGTPEVEGRMPPRQILSSIFRAIGSWIRTLRSAGRSPRS